MQCSTTPSIHYTRPSRLGKRIRSAWQSKKIPDDQEQNAGKLRKRRRDMEESATQHAAERRSDKPEKRVDAGSRAAAARWNSLSEKGRQYGLVETITKEKGGTAHIE